MGGIYASLTMTDVIGPFFSTRYSVPDNRLEPRMISLSLVVLDFDLTDTTYADLNVHPVGIYSRYVIPQKKSTLTQISSSVLLVMLVYSLLIRVIFRYTYIILYVVFSYSTVID